MTDNKYLAWTSLALFVLSVGTILLFLLFATLFSNAFENPGIFIPVIGAFSLLGTLMGFLSFKAPQAKVGGIGGLAILLLVLFVIPVGRETSVAPLQSEVGFREKTNHTGIPDVDHVIDIVLARDLVAQVQLLQFSTLPCTYREGLGGPPKCLDGEAEGTEVEAFPILGPEGHHLRKEEMADWAGIQASDVYAVYRNTKQVYSDEAYPAGEYAIMFTTDSENFYLTLQVTGGKIVRLDNNFGNPADIDLEQAASEIILAPQQ